MDILLYDIRILNMNERGSDGDRKMNFLDTIDHFEKIKQDILTIKSESVSSWTYDDVKLKVDFCNYVMNELSIYGSRKGFNIELPNSFLIPTARGLTDLGTQEFIKANLKKLEYLNTDDASQITDKAQNNYKAVLQDNKYDWMLPVLHRPQELKVVATAVMDGLKNEALEYLNYYMMRNMIDYTKLAGLKEQSSLVCIYATILDTLHECKYSSSNGFPERMLAMEIRETVAMAKALGSKLNLQQLQFKSINFNEFRNCRKACEKFQMQIYCQELAYCVESIIQNKKAFKKLLKKNQLEILQAKYYFEKVNSMLKDSQIKFIFKPEVTRIFKEIVTSYHIDGVNKNFIQNLNRFTIGEAHYKLGLQNDNAILKKANLALEKYNKNFSR